MAVLHMLKSATDTICESFIFKDNGRLLVVDGGFSTIVVRGWMSEMGVRKHYVNLNGPHAIRL